MKFNFKLLYFLLAVLVMACKSENKHKTVEVEKEIIDDYSAKIDSLIQITNPRKFNGVILITKNGKTVYSKAQGYSDFENKTPISLDDNFRIQSNSKQITAVLILREVEKGTIDLQSPIKKYLPNLKQPWIDKVTVHQLLNMSSGVVDINKPLQFEPGTGFRYSNPAYGLLGEIIKNVTGEDYAKVANSLFKELGMNSTFCYEMNKTNNNLIKGYRISGENYELLTFNSFKFTPEQWANFIPAGGIISNLKDLNIWDTKLHNGEVLKEKTYAEMINSDVVDDYDAFSYESSLYGYGVNISDKTNVKFIGHAGRGMGFANIKFYIPEKNIDVIILENVYNANDDIIYYFEKEIRELILKSSLVK